MSFKVMFIYPNHKGMNMLPPGVALLSAVLKQAGFAVKLFDTTYYNSLDLNQSSADVDSDKSKSDSLMARPYQNTKEVQIKYTNPYQDFVKEVEDFQPNLLALSATEDMWQAGIDLLKGVRSKYDILTIAGGVFPTFAPELALSYPEIDIVCKGEGEDALLALCQRLEKGQKFDDINNLWIKKKDGIVSNPLSMVNMDANPLIDMSLFDEARYYRPMGGRVWRMFPVETHRGCPYKCAFCNSPAQMTMYRKETNSRYLRRKSFENILRELRFYKYEMKAEYLYFWADTFFSWSRGEFDTFAELYKEIDLPFWCQTRVETVTKENLEKLESIGCARLSFGLEHGNADFRAKKLHRKMPNSLIVEKLKIVREVGIPFSVNNIMGFPEETRELAFDTIELNRQFEADDRNAYQFTPFHGTPLRDECERLGLIKPEQLVKSMVAARDNVLNMPQFNRNEINGIIKTFNMYVKFPKARWPEIKLAEADTLEGQRIYNNLKQEFVETFWKKQDTSFESAASNQVIEKLPPSKPTSAAVEVAP